MSITITQTQTKPIEVLTYQLKVRSPIEKLISKLEACNCFDAAKKQEIKEWSELFLKCTEKEEAIQSLCYLLVTYIRPNFVNPTWQTAMVGFQMEIAAILKEHVPENTNIDALISEYEKSYFEEERVASQSALINHLFQTTIARLHEELLKIDDSIGGQFEKMKKEVVKLIDAERKAVVALGKDANGLQEQLKTITNRQLALSADQNKILNDVNTIVLTHKTTIEKAQGLQG